MKVVGAKVKVQGNVALAEAHTTQAKAPARRAVVEVAQAKASVKITLP
jgi:hypothetical protein